MFKLKKKNSMMIYLDKSLDAYGYCQINKNFNPEMQQEYRNLKTYQQRIDYCYGQYKAWVDK